MIEVYEIDYERAKESAKNFGTIANIGDRFFIMEEKGEIGFATVGLCGKDVIIKEVITDKPFAYFDLLTRTVLNALKNLPNSVNVFVSQKVIELKPEYFFRFGFRKTDDCLVVNNIDIDLSGTCKKGE